MSDFKHKTPIQIRFKDLDSLGHVNNANHLTYIELARVRYFDEIVGTQIDWSKEGVILARVEIDYIKPILLNDTVVVYTRCARVGSKSFDLEWKIVNEKPSPAEVLASGKVVLVCFDYTTNTTIAVPDLWKQRMDAYEAK